MIARAYLRKSKRVEGVIGIARDGTAIFILDSIFAEELGTNSLLIDQGESNVKESFCSLWYYLPLAHRLDYVGRRASGGIRDTSGAHKESGVTVTDVRLL